MFVINNIATKLSVDVRRCQISLENSLSQLAQAIFEPNLFPINTPTFIKRSSFFTPTCLWRWNRVFRNVGI